MLYWAAIFCVVALVATVFGLGGIAGVSIGIVQILLVIFVVLAAVAEDLQRDHAKMANRMHTLFTRAEAAHDPVTADLATQRAAFHEKAAWMLHATAAG